MHAAEFMRLALKPGGGSDGVCYGDSGCPDLLGGTDIVLSVNSYVTSMPCAAPSITKNGPLAPLGRGTG